jgi:L-threonylcarbamoyladenylate synthase
VSGDPDALVAALREGLLVLLPTDTVLGLACRAADEGAAGALYRLKGRRQIQPTAVLFTSVAGLRAELPGLEGLAADAVERLLPGPYTLVVPNPDRRFRWLCGAKGALGVRVPVLAPGPARVLEQAGPLAATSANLPGGADPCRLGDVPEAIRRGVAGALEATCPLGVPSTVVDVCGHEPVVVREGAVAAERVLESLARGRHQP